MKTIIYNDDYLDRKDINKEVKRAKILVINSRDEILLAYSHKNYFLVGGHIEGDETYDECVVREVKEEMGIDVGKVARKPYLVVEYLCKNYPEVGDNTNYIANYYVVKSDLEPDLSKITLTDSEKKGGFELKYIHKDEVMNLLEKAMETCSNKNVVRDTIDAVREFLRQN